MSIAYLFLGIIAGITAAMATLLAGHGFLLAFAAYVLGGMIGIALCVAWMLRPRGPLSPEPVMEHPYRGQLHMGAGHPQRTSP